MISKSLNAAEWAGRIAEPLRNDLAGKLPYEIQDYCFHYVTRVLNRRANRSHR